MKRKLLLAATLLVAALAGYLAAWPAGIAPQAWQPSPDPGFSGAFAENDALGGVERLFENDLEGAEFLTVNRRGKLVAGLADGRIVALEPGREPRTLTVAGGRPLGFAQSPVGVYLVADPLHGLMGAKGRRRFPLAAEAAGAPVRYATDVALTAKVDVYFLDASSRFGFGHSYDEFLEHGAGGRLLRYDDATGATHVVRDGLHFPTGLLATPDDALLISETPEYRVLRHWLAGPKAGTTEPFVEGLPGFPAHLSWNGRDTYWLALYAPRVPAFDRWAQRPGMRTLVARLPAALQPHPPRRAIVLGLDRDGHVVHNLQYAGADAFAPVTSVVEHDGWLWLGSLTQKGVARIRAPGAGPAPVPSTPPPDAPAEAEEALD